MSPYQKLMDLLQRVALGDEIPIGEVLHLGDSSYPASTMTLAEFVALRNQLFEVEMERIVSQERKHAVLSEDEFRRMFFGDGPQL